MKMERIFLSLHLLRTGSPTSCSTAGEARVLVSAVHRDSHSARVAMQAVCAHSSSHTDRTAAVSPPTCVPLQQLLFSPEDLDDASQDLPHYIRILREFPSITPSPSQKHRSRWGGSQGPNAGMSERRMPWTSTAAGTSTAVMDVWRKKPLSAEALIHSFASSCTAETVVNRYVHGFGDAVDFCRALECIIAGFCHSSRKRHGRKKLSGTWSCRSCGEFVPRAWCNTSLGSCLMARSMQTLLLTCFTGSASPRPEHQARPGFTSTLAMGWCV